MPEALSVGVDYELFWELNPTLLKPFFKAYQLKSDRHMQEESMISYWNGIYVAHAVSLIGGGKFPNEPLKLFKTFEELEKENREPTEEEILQERQRIIDGLKMMEINFKLNHPKE